MTQHRNQSLPDGIIRDQIRALAREFYVQRMSVGYKSSHTNDVQRDDKVCPIRTIVAMATKMLTALLPELGFSAGKGANWLHLLKESGFELTRKNCEN